MAWTIRGIMVGAVIGLVQFATASPAHAVITFTDTYDWSAVAASGSEPSLSTFTDSALPTWTHNITFSPPAAAILTAFLEIRSKGNGGSTPCNNSGELWFAQSSTSIFIGNLSCSTGGTGWMTDTFAIPVSLYPTLPASGWSLSLRLNENTSGTDSIALDYAKLYGTYSTSVPEPGTLALLGLGLLGLGVMRRKAA